MKSKFSTVKANKAKEVEVEDTAGDGLIISSTNFNGPTILGVQAPAVAPPPPPPPSPPLATVEEKKPSNMHREHGALAALRLQLPLVDKMRSDVTIGTLSHQHDPSAVLSILPLIESRSTSRPSTITTI